MTETPVPIKPAATIILARDTVDGFEVLMLKRTTQVTFAKGMHVFPGGGLDAQDQHEEIVDLCVGLDDEQASHLLGIEQGGLAYWIAAVRECFEEAGLVLGYHADEKLFSFDQAEADRLAALRADFTHNKLSFVEILKQLQLQVATDRIHYFSHWVTKAGQPRRYDTRFFVARAPSQQIPMQDNSETVAHLWVRPQVALEMGKVGELSLMFPTIKTLEALAEFDSVDDLLTHAKTPRKILKMNPKGALDRDGQSHLLIPGDPAYAEITKIDVENKGHCRNYIAPGLPTKIGEDIIRLTAANAGMMTGPGTNTYLLGNTLTGIAVIDPGPADQAHIDNILEHAAGNIKWVLCTHTHKDHSPAAQLLKNQTGAILLGMAPPPHDNQDQTFMPDVVLNDGDYCDVGGMRLQAIHTPGHASNHLCFLLEAERLLFTGDHIMQGSTVVINPPDGHLATYLASLRKITSLNIDYLAPGHGFLMHQPLEAVERLLVHRQDRENKVLKALREVQEPITLETLVTRVYDDVPSGRHAIATRSLLAHLHKLLEDKRVISHPDSSWQLSN